MPVTLPPATDAFIEGEGPAHVRAPRIAAQPHLRCAGSGTTQQGHPRKPDVPGEIIGLVEPAPEAPPPMRRDGHHRIGVVEQRLAGRGHQLSEGRRHRPPPVVLEAAY